MSSTAPAPRNTRVELPKVLARLPGQTAQQPTTCHPAKKLQKFDKQSIFE
jgi:hypothetical protein